MILKIWKTTSTIRFVCLQAVAPAEIFLAIEMTEHIPFGSNQLRKIGILDLHAHHGIPTIFVASRSGFRPMAAAQHSRIMS